MYRAICIMYKIVTLKKQFISVKRMLRIFKASPFLTIKNKLHQPNICAHMYNVISVFLCMNIGNISRLFCSNTAALRPFSQMSRCESNISIFYDCFNIFKYLTCIDILLKFSFLFLRYKRDSVYLRSNGCRPGSRGHPLLQCWKYDRVFV